MPTDEQIRRESTSSSLKNMEAIAARMRALIVAMPPKELLGYIYAQRIIKIISEQSSTETKSKATAPDNIINENQLLLEYVHAVLASDPYPENVKFDETACVELYGLVRKLQQQAMFYAMATSTDAKGGVFNSDTANIEYQAKFNWVSIRGNRYQVLEGEFYLYVLSPHDDMLKEVYGVGANDIASGFQAMANAARAGYADALDKLYNQIDDAKEFAAERNEALEEAMGEWTSQHADQIKISQQISEDLFFGGTANVSHHTSLPPSLLEDLSYRRGEETEFFAPGDFAGTPYRTLPARKKPLIRLGDDYYAVDPCFARDAGYRSLIFSLLERKPDYKVTFNKRQKVMSESAFADILSLQLKGAKIFNEIYYKDPESRQWAENDTLILMEDMLFLVEAKAGAAATIASPALDFDRHMQSIQDLVIKAYKQCERFFNYLNSADSVPLYHLINGKYKECVNIRRDDYHLLFPIGLTVESFSPFASYCKDFLQINPILGKHAFISLSIDDLFVLKRLLPTPGEFSHYMEVRQAVAGLRRAHLFDEIDHLGAYLKKNRFDLDMVDQLKGGKTGMVYWVHTNYEIDQSFEGEDWESRPFPRQEFPQEILKLLGALDANRAPGWISAERNIRNLGEQGRNDLATMLTKLRGSLNQYPARYFAYGGDTPLFIWLQKSGEDIDWQRVNEKACAAALATSAEIPGIMIEATVDGIYRSAYTFKITKPSSRNEKNAHIYDDAARMKMRMHPPSQSPTVQLPKISRIGRKPGRNDPCPCQSGLKYKKCHGR